ncbi:MAG TPA: hypothetical protein VLA36_07335 [Longimicrobiales bacterium]|nr:hypothetical protein [Longimicrobiales bacterium]
MVSLPAVLTVVHLVGVALGLGSATAKLRLLLRCRADPAFVAVFLEVTKPLTRQIVLGLVMLVVSGIGWIIIGYPFTPLLITKMVLVGAMFVMGPIIDNVVEPKFKELAPGAGEAPSPEFIRVRGRYLGLEAAATSLFYVIVVMWVIA